MENVKFVISEVTKQRREAFIETTGNVLGFALRMVLSVMMICMMVAHNKSYDPLMQSTNIYPSRREMLDGALSPSEYSGPERCRILPSRKIQLL